MKKHKSDLNSILESKRSFSSVILKRMYSKAQYEEFVKKYLQSRHENSAPKFRLSDQEIALYKAFQKGQINLEELRKKIGIPNRSKFYSRLGQLQVFMAQKESA